MNRRMFFAGLLGLPIAAKVVAIDPVVLVPFNEYFDALVPASRAITMTMRWKTVNGDMHVQIDDGPWFRYGSRCVQNVYDFSASS